MAEFDVDEILSALRAQSDKACAPGKVEPLEEVVMSEETATALANKCLEIVKEQPCLLDLHAPVCLVGDIHGQYKDFLRALDKGGWPPETNYLFLGDFVDRGKHSFETVWLAMAMKIKYPENVFLMRGNHECANINRIYGFYDDCKRRYDSIKLWKVYNQFFEWLPLAAIIENRIFVTHGGLSPDLKNVDDIRAIERPAKVPDHGLVCDLLWSDPDEDINGWGENDRGVSYKFGADIVSQFLKDNDFDLVVRAHQVVEHGYEFFGDKNEMVTIFSAPNYCGEFDNAGALLVVNKDLVCKFVILQPEEKESTQDTNVPQPANES